MESGCVSALVLAAAIASSIGPSPVEAAAPSVVVDGISDSEIPADGKCSLREAIANVQGDTETTLGDCTSGATTDLVEFDPLLSNSQIDLTITGRDSAISARQLPGLRQR